MTPYGEAVRRIHVRYYLVAVLFILFDVDVIFSSPGQFLLESWAFWDLSRCSSLWQS